MDKKECLGRCLTSLLLMKTVMPGGCRSVAAYRIKRMEDSRCNCLVDCVADCEGAHMRSIFLLTKRCRTQQSNLSLFV